MKKLGTILLTSVALAFLIVPTAFAQTPDSQTPAEEMVCDPLSEDGITKGLYGLCVAFCEAQDHADLFDPITEEDLEAIEAEAPSGKILANYNKKRDKANNPADPPMPCILVEEPCPCWSTEELAAVDGYYPDGVMLDTLSCSSQSGGQRLVILERDRDSQTVRRGLVWLRPSEDENSFCRWTERQSEPDVIRFLSTDQGSLTRAEAEECHARVVAACSVAGL